MAVLMLAPLFMGGRHPLGELVYLGIVCLIAIAWVVRQSLPSESSYLRTGIEFWLACCFCLLAAQLIPLPASLISWISPGTTELLPLWSAETEASTRLGNWSTISLFPQATRAALTLFIAHVMLFVVVVQRLRSLSDIEWLLRCIAVAVVGMAVVGLVQLFAGNGKFLGIYEHPFRDTNGVATGAFINENHFAHFLALGAGPLMWWLARFFQGDTETRERSTRERSTRRGIPSASMRGRGPDKSFWQRFGGLILSTALGIVVFAGLLSYSRGGVLVLLLSMSVCGGLLAWKTQLNRAAVVSFSAVVSLGVIGSVAVTAVLIFGLTRHSEGLATFTEGSLEAIDHASARRDLWQANLQAFEWFPIFGTGGGSHVEVYKAFYDEYSPVEYTHAESGYVQVLSEYGLAGVTLLAFASSVVIFWCVRTVLVSDSKRHLACSAAVIAGLTASLVHSIWDFVWYLPSCMSIAILLAGCACRLSALAIAESSSSGHQSDRLWFAGSRPLVASRLVWITASVVICATSVLIVDHHVGAAVASTHWERFLATANMLKENPNEEQRELASRTSVKHLENTVAADPNNARANLKLAATYMYRFDVRQQTSLNPIPLSVIREAVLASNFPTSESRDSWLATAVGANWQLLKKARYYARRSLQLCPLQGEGYLLLSQLAFLGDGNNARRTSLLEQAIRVRPQSGEVLIAVGAEAARVGDIEQALVTWKRAFQFAPEYQAQLIALLAPQVDPAFFLTHFQPDSSGLGLLYEYYRQRGRDADAMAVGPHLGESLVGKARAKKGIVAAKYWREAHLVYRDLGDPDLALSCATEGVRIAPNNFSTRRTLAFELANQNQFDQAIEQLKWCLYRKPSDPALTSALKRAHNQRNMAATASLNTDDPLATGRR